jgi:hypothetical protein
MPEPHTVIRQEASASNESRDPHRLHFPIDVEPQAVALAVSEDSDRSAGPASPESDRSSQEATWPPPFLSQAKLVEAKGWHLLNEFTYGLWAVTTAGRETVHILGWVKGEPGTYSISSHLPSSNEGAMVSGAFAVLEAAGTAHLVRKEQKKKSDIVKALAEHAAGRDRFIGGNTEIAALLGERHALLTLLERWPRDETAQPLPEWKANPTSPLLSFERTQSHREKILSELEKLALDLAADYEHYVLYEQAANQLAESTDNVRSMGVAAARDCVVQLGGTACNAADTAVKLGAAHGVDLVANSIAGGAFGVAMGALHIGSGMVGWYQAERRLADLELARSRRTDLQTVQGREQLVQEAAEHHRQWLIAQADRTQSAGVREVHMARATAPASAATVAADVATAKALVGILMHHQREAFDTIEAAERIKLSRAKFRMRYGALSMVMGAGFIIAATVASGGIFPLVLTTAALALGTFWIVSGIIRSALDRVNASGEKKRESQLKAQAQRIRHENRDPTSDEMRDNKFVAIDSMLGVLLDGDRPVTRCALTDALASLGMDANLLEALRLRSTIRLDKQYAKDKEEIDKLLRCFSSQARTEVLKRDMNAMELRSDEAILKPLRQLFQQFIEGHTAMRQQYERRTDALTFLRGKVRELLRNEPGVDASPQQVARQVDPAAIAAFPEASS